MAKKYLTPDFDVTVYEIKDIVTLEVGPSDPDGGIGDPEDWNGPLN